MMGKPAFTPGWFQELVVFAMEHALIDLLEADERF
jgi:hypothetical protein